MTKEELKDNIIKWLKCTGAIDRAEWKQFVARNCPNPVSGDCTGCPYDHANRSEILLEVLKHLD